jgi:UBX domain-containing protein 1
MCARGTLQVDESQPTISVQVRLHDGKRLTAKFNLHHTVAHLQQRVLR